MGISKPSQAWAKHQKDMAVLSSSVSCLLLSSSLFSRGCVKHQKDLAVLSFFTSGSINSTNPDGTCLSGIDLIYKAIATPKGELRFRAEPLQAGNHKQSR
ncbi:hypothetical protein I6M38_19430 [Shewanella algae]|uniref:hypothetical protein n=1 Tax=Shewanella algae TaxID=38313 RepID=UPI001AACCE23|nr:hypothetical protein [Shewanella algae]MBO2554125.1 hypothetical protein [Shewanella algae]